MTTLEVLTAIQTSPLAHAISKSNHMVAAGLQIVHVVGFVLLLASLALVSLRLLGVLFRDQPVTAIARDATRLLWLGVALTAVSGTLMFISAPRLYFFNPAFQVKMVLLAGAVLVQIFLNGRASRVDQPSVALARVSAVLSLFFWFGVGLAGRVIGFI